jgi:hypothetical protein
VHPHDGRFRLIEKSVKVSRGVHASLPKSGLVIGDWIAMHAWSSGFRAAALREIGISFSFSSCGFVLVEGRAVAVGDCIA